MFPWYVKVTHQFTLDRGMPPMSNKPAIKILRIRDVLERVGIKRSTLYNLMKTGAFPRPVPLSPGAVGWRSDDIDAWIESRSRRSA